MSTQAKIVCQSLSNDRISSSLLGFNLEMVFSSELGLMTNRLKNPHFEGPADALTGLARNWKAMPFFNSGGVSYKLVSGGMKGTNAQVIEANGSPQAGILQTGVKLVRGDKLEAVFWARAQYEPLRLALCLKAIPFSRAPYSEKSIIVDMPFWKEYRVILEGSDDHKAVFCMFLPDGDGTIWIDQVHLRPVGAGLINQNLINSMREIGVPVIRFPGGCNSTIYHWEWGVGAPHLRRSQPDLVFKYLIPYDYGTDEYLQTCSDVGASPQITVNISTGTPEEAGEWAAYCARWFAGKGIDPPLIYWQIGNEHYLKSEIGNMSGEIYAEVLKAFVPILRQAYPNNKIIALGPEQCDDFKNKKTKPWRCHVLKNASDYFDILALHHYHSSPDDGNETRCYQDTLSGLSAYDKMISDICEDYRKYHLQGKGIAFTEWGLWLTAAHYDEKDFHEPFCVKHGIFCASVIHIFARHAPVFELGNLYSLLNNMGVLLSKDGKTVEWTDVAQVYALYGEGFPGSRVNILQESPCFANNIAGIDALCLEKNGNKYLYLINRMDQSTIFTALVGFGVIQDVEMLVGTETNGHFTIRKMENCSSSIDLPPLSISKIRFVS